MKTFDYLTNGETLKRYRVLYGIVTACGWDLEGNPARFSLFTVDEDDVLLVDCSSGRKLKKFIHGRVEVIGEFREDECGDFFFQVRDIKRVNFMKYQFLTKQVSKGLYEIFNGIPVCSINENEENYLLDVG